ncbi:HARBI1 [Mytilus coruscus]|uniref:HARBI1 n=1 Tax=Mytilus coruscus TaxID=42192 RepID=A0A6J8AEC0_MYTCO|nr:HARBI1 [Mytilus coruscus]
MANQLLFGNVFALRKQRVYRDRIELATLSDRQIRSRFRFKRESIQFISDLLRNDLSHTTRNADSYQISKKSLEELQPQDPSLVMLALRFYASGSFLEVIGDTMGVDKATACRAVNDVTNALLSKKDQFIKWPARQEERDRNKQGFFRGGLFPGVIGCIDGTHVKIQAPSEDDPPTLMNSINVQGYVTMKRRFHVLHGEVRMKPAKVCRIIGACAILHNIAIMLREPMEDDESGENQEDVGQMNYNGPEDGRTIRNFITTSYF